MTDEADDPVATHVTESDVTSDAEPAGTFDTRRVAKWAGDAIAIVVLLVIFVWLSYHDGGYPFSRLADASTFALLAVPVVAYELARLPRKFALLVAAWWVGPVIAFAFAAERSGFVRSVMVTGLIPLVGLLAVRLWRRAWGPHALLILMLVTLGVYWERSFVQWYGFTDMGRGGRWLPLSWHNQGGTLMAGLGIMFAGLAIMSQRIAFVIAGGLAAAGGLAGVWLSSSRGAIVVAGLGLLVVVFAAGRSGRLTSALVGAAGILGTTAVAVLLLLSTNPEGAQQPLVGEAGEQRQAATTNLRARLWHMEAAAGMFLDRPLVGHGPGSYNVTAPSFTRPQANLTAYAHNEYAEALGEGGLVTAIPVLLLLGGAGILVVRRVRGRARPSEAGGDGNSADATSALREALVVGAAGSVSVLGIHAAIDFDWQYAVLPALLAVGVATLSGENIGESDHGLQSDASSWLGRLVSVVGVVALASLLALGIWGTRVTHGETTLWVETTSEHTFSYTPWDSSRAVSTASALIQEGQLEASAAAIERTLNWNPGNDMLNVLAAVVDYRGGDIGTEDLVRVLDSRPFGFFTHIVTAEALLEEHEHNAARRLLDATIEKLPEYRNWGVGPPALRAWTLLVRIDAETVGCDQARKTAERAAEEIPPVSRVPVPYEQILDATLNGHCPA